MEIAVDLPPDIEASLLAQSQAKGLSLPEYLRLLITDHVEDLEDVQIAQARLTDRQPSITGSQLRKNLGLEG